MWSMRPQELTGMFTESSSRFLSRKEKRVLRLHPSQSYHTTAQPAMLCIQQHNAHAKSTISSADELSWRLTKTFMIRPSRNPILSAAPLVLFALPQFVAFAPRCSANESSRDHEKATAMIARPTCTK